jgi:hypothetical protein
MELSKNQRWARSLGESMGKTFGLILALSFVTLFLLAATGWVMNIINVFQITDPITIADGLSVIGIFVVPLGMIMGWVI